MGRREGSCSLARNRSWIYNQSHDMGCPRERAEIIPIEPELVDTCVGIVMPRTKSSVAGACPLRRACPYDFPQACEYTTHIVALP